MSNFDTDESSGRPVSANTGTIISQKESIGSSQGSCKKFIELLSSEKITCETCVFDPLKGKTDKEILGLLKKCQDFDCMSDVHPCEDYNCPSNLFSAHGAGPKKLNDICKITRNCEWGIVFFLDNITLEELSELYGISRERIRQIEREALIHIGNKMRFSKELRPYIPKNGMENLQKIIDTRDAEGVLRNERNKRRRAGIKRELLSYMVFLLSTQKSEVNP
jgi:hypothetical protein